MGTAASNLCVAVSTFLKIIEIAYGEEVLSCPGLASRVIFSSFPGTGVERWVCRSGMSTTKTTSFVTPTEGDLATGRLS